jgi:hypothetical protein
MWRIAAVQCHACWLLSVVRIAASWLCMLLYTLTHLVTHLCAQSTAVASPRCNTERDVERDIWFSIFEIWEKKKWMLGWAKQQMLLLVRIGVAVQYIASVREREQRREQVKSACDLVARLMSGRELHAWLCKSNNKWKGEAVCNRSSKLGKADEML